MLFFNILAFIVIFIVVDLIENLDKFLSFQASFFDVLLYYIYYMPYISILTLPIAMLLSSLFSLGSMAQYNEIIAMQSAGVSNYRVMLPVVMLAFLVSIAVGLSGETIVPQTNQARLDVYRYNIKKENRTIETTRNQLAIQDGENRQMYIQVYETARQKAHKVNVIWTRQNRVVKRWDARVMQWKPQQNIWVLHDVIQRQLSDTSEQVTAFDSVAYLESTITPEDLTDLEIEPEEMNYTELRRFVNKMKELGADARRWLVDLHMKIAYPFANLIIVLFGAPLAARKRRSGPALGFALALLISFIYFLFLRSGQVLGHKGTLEPWLAAWIGNIVFGVGAIFMMLRLRR